MSRSLAKAASLLLLTGGCAIHPLPQDVTNLDTYAIVAQVRCEMRSVLKRRVINAVRSRRLDAHLVDELEVQIPPLATLAKRIKDPDLKGVLTQYAGATILYDFSLSMTEANNASGGAGLTRPFTRGSDTIGFTLASDHKRQNIRTFVIDDTFEKLLTITPDAYCDGTTGDPNYNYPIAGRTRLEDTVLTFLDLNQSGNLGTKPSGPKTPTLADDLQFTTKYSGSVSPAFTANPLGPLLSLTGASAKFESSREDLHRVTVVLAMPTPGAKPLPLTIAESRQLAQAALANANANRTQVNIERIADRIPSLIP